MKNFSMNYTRIIYLSDCKSNCDLIYLKKTVNLMSPKYQKSNIIESDSDDELEEEWNEHDVTPNLQNYLKFD